jgi:peptide chain release factor
MITPNKQIALLQRMKELGIEERDLDETFILGSGSGGQKINKTASCVRLKHVPTGIEVKCQKERSREMNRFFARRQLCDQIEEQAGGVSKKQLQQEKIRKQKKRRQRRSIIG